MLFRVVCLLSVPAKMENSLNEEILIPVCILLIVAGIQQCRRNRFGRLWILPWIARRKQHNTYHALKI